MIPAMAFSFLFCFTIGIGLIQAQAEPCNEADWDSLEAVRTDFKALRSEIADAPDLDALNPLAAEHVKWRDALFSTLPPCTEARELGILMTQAIGDSITTAAAERIPDATAADDPIAEYLLETDARIEAYFAPDRPVDSSTGAPAPAHIPCSLTEANNDFDLNAGWRRIAESTPASEGQSDPASSATLLLEWRAQLWAQLHACRDVFEVAFRFNLITGDYVASARMRAAGLPAVKNPYYPSIEANLRRIRDLLNAHLADEPDTGLDLEVNLPDCGKEALESISPDDKDFLKLWLALRGGLESVEDVLAWNESMLAWRDATLLAVPRCREAIDFALTKTWILGDYNPSLLVDAMGYPAEENWYELERSHQVTRYGDLILAADSLDRSQRQTDDQTMPCRPATRPNSMRFSSTVTGILKVLSTKPPASQRHRDFVDYGIYRATWRDFHWRLLPPCSEALEMALVMNAYEMDVLAYLTLRSLSLPVEDNPFRQRFSLEGERIRQMAAAAGLDIDRQES